MRCAIRRGEHAGFRVLYVHGELDHDVCPEFESTLAALASEQPPCFILDLLDVPYSNAAPLRTVVEAHRTFVSRGGVLAVVCCTEYMSKLVEIAGAKDELRLFHQMNAAAAHLSTVCEMVLSASSSPSTQPS